MIEKLTIIIIAFNRHQSLERLLNSIFQTDRAGYHLNLIFSLEKNSSKEVIKIVNDFEIDGILKTIVQSEHHLGAEGHNLAVQQLALNYDNILILEDDSFVSPAIFHYAFSTLNFYNNINIAAISLYPYLWVESVSVPFIPVDDGFINYFQQRPSSHGYILSKNQIIKFNEWQRSFSVNKIELPPNTLRWNKQSWERIWYYYLIETNQFVVFPRVAFNTVFGELGYNVKNADEGNAFQQPLSLSKVNYNFSTPENSMSVYDAFYEFLKYDKFGFKNLEGNIYGTKKKTTIKKEFVVINGFNKLSEKSFGRGLKPIELNILLNNPGKEISIIKKDNYENSLINDIDSYLYFHSLFSIPNTKFLLTYYLRKLRFKLFKSY